MVGETKYSPPGSVGCSVVVFAATTMLQPWALLANQFTWMVMVYTDSHPLNSEPLLKGMLYFKLIRSIFLSLNLECKTMGFAVLIVED